MAASGILFETLRQLPALSHPARKSKHPGVTLQHITPAAHPVLAACIASGRSERCWIAVPNARTQERFFSVLSQWIPGLVLLPDPPFRPSEESLIDPAAQAERLAALEQIHNRDSSPQCILVTLGGLSSLAPRPEHFRSSEKRIVPGQTLERESFLKNLEAEGYEPTSQVFERGQFAVRGGIIDVFGFHHIRPVRIELFGDEVESLREFDPDAQTSVHNLPETTLISAEAPSSEMVPVCEFITAKDRVILSDAFAEEPEWEVPAFKGQRFWIHTAAAPSPEGAPEDDSHACFETGLGVLDAGDFVVDEFKRQRVFQQLEQWKQEGWQTVLFCENEGEQERLREVIPSVQADAIHWQHGSLLGGFVCPSVKLAVLSDAELLGRSARPRRTKDGQVREALSRGPLDFSQLEEGELVVHLEHGIARFDGLRELPREGGSEQVLVLEFADEAKMYVPLEQSSLVARYVGIGKKNPPLSALGDGKWQRARKNAERAVFHYANRLLALHAERETNVGHAFAPDNRWVQEFESAFPYQETPDQLTAIAATKSDMEGTRPMDRLICGDVGFGKTEVAIRAAFKAVMGGKQVALLAPTTVLAEQHYRNFRERMSAFPVRVEMLSRFRTQAQQAETVQALKDGSVDIVIGTHRLLSERVEFKDLGLVVIDEEQRFGVLQKEKMKERFRLIDQLTLSATPIPRTLYLSLMGARDMSTLETPPSNRIPVETFVCPYDERIIRDAIQRELARGGQVYFLHNRIESIQRVQSRLRTLVPSARTVVGHGQMPEHELEEVMHAFVEGKADVLISTTIIESGLDIPNANTIIIDRADRFGLADLYQLRGRVGRGDHQAYAYLMLPREQLTMGEARKRVQAIKQYSSLGAGFKIALRDLEIRGAGNILGTQQSGHIVAVGFDLYCTLLKQAVAQQSGQAPQSKPETVQVRLDFVCSREADFSRSEANQKAPAFLPLAYVSHAQTRIAAYRKLAEVQSETELEELDSNWRDRFGARMPEAASNLLTLHYIRLRAAQKRISTVEVRELKVMLQRKGDYLLIGNKFPRLNAAESPSERLRSLLGLINNL